MVRLTPRQIVVGIVTLCAVSLSGNIFLGWRWQADRTHLSLLLSSKEGQLLNARLTNNRLSKANSEFQQDLTLKDQELQATVDSLNKKQKELDALATDYIQKKKEVDAKTAELLAAQKRIDDQKSQLDKNSSELAKLRNRPPLFSFQVEATNISDIETKKAEVKQVVTDAYDVIESVYGKPYLLNSVTITFVDSFTNTKASGEIVISNSNKGLDLDIHLKDFDRNNFTDVNTVIHEVIHSFHGLSAINPTAFEEGITVATADIVMKKMITAGSIPNFSPLYIRISDADYQAKQTSLSIPRDLNSFYSSDQVATYYQVLGKAWYMLYQTDNNLFKKFNEKIYEQKNNGEEITEELVLSTLKSLVPGVDLTGAAWQLQ